MDGIQRLSGSIGQRRVLFGVRTVQEFASKSINLGPCAAACVRARVCTYAVGVRNSFRRRATSVNHGPPFSRFHPRVYPDTIIFRLLPVSRPPFFLSLRPSRLLCAPCRLGGDNRLPLSRNIVRGRSRATKLEEDFRAFLPRCFSCVWTFLSPIDFLRRFSCARLLINWELLFARTVDFSSF